MKVQGSIAQNTCQTAKKFRQVTEIETTTSLGSKEPHQADELYLVTRLEKTSSSVHIISHSDKR